MASKTKKIRILILMAVLLAALVGVYFALTGGEPAKKEAIVASQIDSGSVAALSYSYGNKTVELVKQGGIWILASDEETPLKQSVISAMVYAASNVNAEMIVYSGSGDYRRFNLDDPDITILLTLNNGNILTYYLSRYRSDDSRVYFTVHGTSKVYFVQTALFQWFTSELATLVEMAPFPFPEKGNVTGVAVSSENSSIELKNSAGNWSVKNRDGIYLTADDRKAGSLLDFILFLSPEACAYYIPSDEELAACGLSDPADVVSISADKPFSVFFGNRDESDSYYYTAYSGSSMIYYVKKSSVEQIFGTSEAGLLHEQVVRVEAGTIRQLTVTFDGSESIVRANDRLFETIFSSIADLRMEGLAAERFSITVEEPYISVKIELETAGILPLLIYPYDLNFYRVSFEGNEYLLVEENQIRKLIGELQACF